MAFSSLAELVKTYESGGGDYTAKSPTSTASGAYQFTNPTWLTHASAAGYDTTLYPTAASAPPAVQDAVFAQTVQQNGLQDWTCPGCNSAISAYVAGHNANDLPVFDGGTTSGQGYGSAPVIDVGGPSYDPTIPAGQQGSQYAPSGQTDQSGGGSNTSANLSASQPGYLPPSWSGGPSALGITPGLATGIGGWIGGIETAVGNAFTNAFSSLLGSITNWFVRGMLILVGLVLVALALWALMSKATGAPSPGQTAKAALAAA